MDDRTGVTEPVSWDSRLARTPGVTYTEVAGTPVLIDPATSEIQPLTATLATVWAQLDGRSIADSLGVDPGSLSDVDRRNLIEVLRRLKARGLIIDVPSGPSGDEPGDWLLEPGDPGTVRCEFRGRVHHSDDWRLTIDGTCADQVRLRLAERDGHVRVTVRRRLWPRRIDRVVVPDVVPSAISPEVGALAGIVDALVDTEVLTAPGVADLFAGLAERAHPPGSPRR